MKILKNELDSIKGENKNLQETHVKTADKNRKLEVEMICEKLLTDDHHHPSMVGVAKQIMLSDSTGSKVIKFTETVGEGDDKKTIDIELSIKDAVLRILEAVPKTQRANYSENSTSDNGVQLSEVEQTNLENDAIRKSMRKKGLKIVETKGK